VSGYDCCPAPDWVDDDVSGACYCRSCRKTEAEAEAARAAPEPLLGGPTPSEEGMRAFRESIESVEGPGGSPPFSVGDGPLRDALGAYLAVDFPRSPTPGGESASERGRQELRWLLCEIEQWAKRLHPEGHPFAATQKPGEALTYREIAAIANWGIAYLAAGDFPRSRPPTDEELDKAVEAYCAARYEWWAEDDAVYGIDPGQGAASRAYYRKAARAGVDAVLALRSRPATDGEFPTEIAEAALEALREPSTPNDRARARLLLSRALRSRPAPPAAIEHFALWLEQRAAWYMGEAKKDCDKEVEASRLSAAVVLEAAADALRAGPLPPSSNTTRILTSAADFLSDYAGTKEPPTQHVLTELSDALRSMALGGLPPPREGTEQLLRRAADLLGRLGDGRGLPMLDETLPIQIEAEALAMEIENTLSEAT
jgi:hypothetical protein